ncbi:MAG TPA: DUF1338 family protein [Rhizomicrobium sp.]|jgi:hypothetical protein
MPEQTTLALLLTGAASALTERVAIAPSILQEKNGAVSRATLAAALNLQLLAGLLERVPSGRAYMDDLAKAGRKLVFDHGAMRTVARDGMGTLPTGLSAIARVLEPLGYHVTHTYPMPRLKMTGRSFTHRDLPEELPQFFVSELHSEHFSPEFQDAVRRVTEDSEDPLSACDLVRLARLSGDGALPLEDARALLPKLAACFTRRHEPPALADYEILKPESAEMAWIATEGNAFNHATDRVPVLDTVVEEQIAQGRRVKERIEISASGRVRQTALHADPVMRDFRDKDGAVIQREVPGSFFEFIARTKLPDEDRLDLAFDTNNAQGIFKMTAA